MICREELTRDEGRDVWVVFDADDDVLFEVPKRFCPTADDLSAFLDWIVPAINKQTYSAYKDGENTIRSALRHLFSLPEPLEMDGIQSRLRRLEEMHK